MALDFRGTTTSSEYDKVIVSEEYQGVKLKFCGRKPSSILHKLVDGLCSKMDQRFPENNTVIEATKIIGFNNWPAKENSSCIIITSLMCSLNILLLPLFTLFIAC